MVIRKIGAIFFWILSIIALLGIIAFGWFFRDGVYTDAIESHGLLALSRMWKSEMGWGLVFFAAPLAAIGWLLYPRQYQRGVFVFLCAYVGASVCTLGCAGIYLRQYSSSNNALYEDAIYEMFLEYVIVPIAVVVGAIIGAAIGWRLTRNSHSKEPVNGT